MELEYLFNPDSTISGAFFSGLTGQERVASVKEAINLMEIQNPAVEFTEAVKRGEYDDHSDEEYAQALASIKCLSLLFRYPDKRNSTKVEAKMDPLTLLSNAMETIVRQDVELRGLREKKKGGKK